MQQLDRNSPSRMSIESPPFAFHYLVADGVCYLTLTDRSYPKKLAFSWGTTAAST